GDAMARRFNRFWLTTFIAVSCVSAARAEIREAPSVEWLTCAAEVVVVGKISKITETKGPGDVTYEDCLVDLDRIVKGNFDGKPITFTLRRLGKQPTAQAWVNSK